MNLELCQKREPVAFRNFDAAVKAQLLRVARIDGRDPVAFAFTFESSDKLIATLKLLV